MQVGVADICYAFVAHHVDDRIFLLTVLCRLPFRQPFISNMLDNLLITLAASANAQNTSTTVPEVDYFKNPKKRAIFSRQRSCRPSGVERNRPMSTVVYCFQQFYALSETGSHPDIQRQALISGAYARENRLIMFSAAANGVAFIFHLQRISDQDMASTPMFS